MSDNQQKLEVFSRAFFLGVELGLEAALKLSREEAMAHIAELRAERERSAK